MSVLIIVRIAERKYLFDAQMILLQCYFFFVVVQRKPEGSFAFQQLNDRYYPGDVGFDPLNLKPSDPEEFATMQTKELQNGRLAMLGAMGMIVQELVE